MKVVDGAPRCVNGERCLACYLMDTALAYFVFAIVHRHLHVMGCPPPRLAGWSGGGPERRIRSDHRTHHPHIYSLPYLVQPPNLERLAFCQHYSLSTKKPISDSLGTLHSPCPSLKASTSPSPLPPGLTRSYPPKPSSSYACSTGHSTSVGSSYWAIGTRCRKSSIR